MADIVTNFRTYLTSKSVVTGTLASAGAIYTKNLPENPALPAIVLNRVSGRRERALTGRLNRTRTRIQVDCFGATHAAAESVSQAVAAAVDDFSGTMGTESITNAFVDNGPDDIHPPTAGTQQFDGIVRADVVLWHLESFPST